VSDLRGSPWHTAAELAAMGLPDWPGSEFRSRAKLKALGVPSRTREGRLGGGGLEFDTSALPVAVRRALLAHRLRAEHTLVPGPSVGASSAAVCAPAPAAVATQATRTPPSRTDAACADARVVLVNHLRNLAQAEGGMTKATKLLARQLATAQVPAALLQSATTANQRPRNPGTSGIHISERTLFRWVGEHRKGGWWALLPAPTQAGLPLASVGDDVALVLRRYASTSGAARNLTQVARDVTAELGRHFDEAPGLYERARRALPKVDKVKLIKARHTGAERAAKLPFKRRSTETLSPNDVWVIDGHTFKAKVRHPDHGQPFAPEVTLAIDAATRKIVGWSVALSESTIAVGDCIRHAVGTHGIPAIVYSDNGAGERAKAFDCPVAGLFARLGSEHRTGIPGHPQGHGLIERSWQTHMLRCARRFPTYQGSDVDERTLRNVSLELAREQRALKRADATGEVVRLSGKAPSWAQFMDAVAESVATYNGQHRHRGLPKHDSGAAQGKHLTPSEAWAAMLVPERQVLLGEAELRHLFMPAVLRTAQRGEVRWLNGHFYSPELMHVDEQQVRVHYDIHDGSRVWVWTLEGQFVCEARHSTAAGGNGIPYFPVSAVEAARARRVQGIVKRRQAQIDTAERELHRTLPAPAAEFQIPGMQVPGIFQPQPRELEVLQRIDATPQPEPVRVDPHARPLCFDAPSDRYEWLMQHRAAWAPEDSAWLAAYAAGSEYRALHDYYASRGIGWPDDPAAFSAAG
jgi:putative transposase